MKPWMGWDRDEHQQEVVGGKEPPLFGSTSPPKVDSKGRSPALLSSILTLILTIILNPTPALTLILTLTPTPTLNLTVILTLQRCGKPVEPIKQRELLWTREEQSQEPPLGAMHRDPPSQHLRVFEMCQP